MALSGNASEFICSEWTTNYTGTTTPNTDFYVETDNYYYKELTTVKWILQWLTPGVQYKATPAISTTGTSSNPTIYWGGSGATRYPPLVFKISDIDDSWGTGGGSGALPGGSGA